MRKTGNRRDRGAKTTIVRRQIKKNHAGHHGGAWKVAFADFTLAMMALFMTLWIVNSVSKSEREKYYCRAARAVDFQRWRVVAVK